MIICSYFAWTSSTWLGNTCQVHVCVIPAYRLIHQNDSILFYSHFMWLDPELAVQCIPAPTLVPHVESQFAVFTLLTGRISLQEKAPPSAQEMQVSPIKAFDVLSRLAFPKPRPRPRPRSMTDTDNTENTENTESTDNNDDTDRPVRRRSSRRPQPELSETPVRMTCPNCGRKIKTRVTYETSQTQHLAFLALMVFCFPCSCVPYCMDSLADVKHTCPKCRAHLGTYKRH